MPKLQDLEIGHNNFTDADLDIDGCYPQWVFLHTVNLNSNRISNWTNVCLTLSGFPLYVHPPYEHSLILRRGTAFNESY
jgi:hypothetical protein